MILPLAIIVALGAPSCAPSQTSTAPSKSVPAESPAALAIDPLAIARKLATDEYKGYVYPVKKHDDLPPNERPKSVDCTTFLDAVMKKVFAEAGKTYSKAISERVRLANFTPDELKQEQLDKLVKTAKDHPPGDERLAGVQFALTKAGFGEVVKPADLKPGDFVQYWYKEGDHWYGHSSVIASVGPTGCVLFGAHHTSLESEKSVEKAKRKGGVGESVPIALTDTTRYLVFAVRFKTN